MIKSLGGIVSYSPVHCHDPPLQVAILYGVNRGESLRELNLQYSPNKPTNPAVPLSMSSPLMPFWPKGKSGTAWHQE